MNPRRGETRDLAKPTFAPRPNNVGPSRAQPRGSSGGRPSVSRGSGGVSRPASRPSSGGSRGSGGGGGGGRGEQATEIPRPATRATPTTRTPPPLRLPPAPRPASA